MHTLPSSCCLYPEHEEVLTIPLGIHAYRYIYTYLVVVQAPRSPYDRVYVLPLLTIKTNKGTGPPSITVLTDYFFWCLHVRVHACVCVSAMRHGYSCLCCMLLAQASCQNPIPCLTKCTIVSVDVACFCYSANVCVDCVILYAHGHLHCSASS